LQDFNSCFTAPTFRRFTSLVTGWVLCRARRWITRVAQVSGEFPDRHHSGFHRFFSHARWEPDDAWQALLSILVKLLPKEIEVIVDDTLCRRTGPRIFGIAMHHDGAASSYSRSGTRGGAQLACGHAWVVLAIRVPVPWKGAGIAVPILAKLYRSPKRCPASEYRKRTEIARDLIEKLASWLPDDRSLHVTGDREYACKTVLRDLDPGIEFTGPMPMDAVLYAPLDKSARGDKPAIGRPRTRGERLPNPAQKTKANSRAWTKRKVQMYGRTITLLTQDWTCLWHTATGLRLIRVVVTRDPKGHYKDRAFFSTQHAASPVKILEMFSHRWLIEVSFREAKQALGMAEAQNGWSRGSRRSGRPKPGPQPRGNRGRHAVERTVPFALITRGIIVVWYLRQDRWKSDVDAHRALATWYRTKRAPSFDDMLGALRLEIIAHRLSSNPLPRRVCGKLYTSLRRLGLAA
tara:strand:+ start:165 stop:1550 length:1386 start_codon:yes stop_codon:yes gene_type:complete